jgi:serine/threonine protein kinase/Tfp pilus assembly protein PilF
MIGQVLTRYRIISKLGEGGMGAVYIAEDLTLGRRVAIKFLAADHLKRHYRARFLREARTASALTHPNIATVYDCGDTPEGVPYIVMELAEGQTLGELIQGGLLTIAHAVEIITKVAEALAEAHRRGIIHRDIKPANIIVGEGGLVKILDFGLAKHLAGDMVAPNTADVQALLATQTCEGVVIGTPMYLSPEQALGVEVDARSDLFSLGSVLYECIAGRPAFPGQSAADVCAKVIRDDPAPPSAANPQVPPELDRITLKALRKRVADRHQSAEELLADLRVMRDLPDSTAPVTPARGASRPSLVRTSLINSISEHLHRPRSLAAVFAVCLGLALLAVWGLSAWRGGAASSHNAEALRWYNEGANALRDGTYNKAVKALERAVDIDDGFTLAHARLAEALAELEYNDRAKNELLRAAVPAAGGATLSPSESLYLQAINRKLTGDLEGAIGAYREIVERAPESERASAYVDLGGAYEKDGDAEKAAQSYLAALQLNPQYTSAAMHLSVIYGKRQDAQSTEKALAQLAAAESLYQTLNDAEGLAEVAYQRGVMYLTRRKLDDARAQFSQALLKAQAIGNTYQQVKARMQLSTLLCLGGQTEEAEREADEVVGFAKANDSEVLTADGLVTLGNAFLGRGSLDEAQKQMERALEVAELYHARRSEARALLALASVTSQRHGEGARVREYVERALNIYRQDGVRKYSMQADALLGHASDQQGDYDSAYHAFGEQLKLAEQLEDREQQALAHEGLGIALTHQERYAEALDHFEQDYKLSDSLGMMPNVSHALANRGQVFSQLGRYGDALSSLAAAAEAASKTSKPDAELGARLHVTTARLELSRRRFSAAEAEARKALELSGGKFQALDAEANAALGLALVSSGATAEGRRLCQQAVDSSRQLDSPRLTAGLLLSLSVAALQEGDAESSLAAASEAQKSFAAAGQQDSEWRAALVEALASRRLGQEDEAQSHAARAAELLDGLRERLGADAYALFLARPDVAEARARLSREFPQIARM